MTAGGPWLAFTHGGVAYALPAEGLRGVVPRPSAARVPGAPPAVLGLVAWRGRVLPLVAPAGGGHRGSVAAAVVMAAGAALVAVAADRVEGWVPGPGAARVLVPAEVLAECRAPGR